MHQECSAYIHSHSESRDITPARSSFSGRRCFFSPADARANVDARYARQLDFDRHVWRHPRGHDSPDESLSDFSSYQKKRSIEILSGERSGRMYAYSRHDVSVQMKQDRWRCGRLIQIGLRSKKLESMKKIYRNVVQWKWSVVNAFIIIDDAAQVI